MSSPMASLLLLCLLTVPAVLSLTTFVFSGDIRCRKGDSYHASITPVRSAWPEPVFFSTERFHGQGDIPYNFTLNVDEGYLDTNYEMRLLVVHTCTTGGRWAFWIDLEHYPVPGTWHVSESFDVTNKGHVSY